MLESQPIRNVLDARLARCCFQRREVSKLGKRRAGPARPRDAVKALGRAPHRQPVSKDAEGEVVRQYIGSRYDRDGSGHNQPDGVDRTSVRIDGAPVLPDRTYRVATSNFLWGGGDDVSALASGTDPVTVGVDVEIAAAYFSRRSPIRSDLPSRVRLIR